MIKSAEESNVSKVQLKQLFYRELFPALADTLLSGVVLRMSIPAALCNLCADYSFNMHGLNVFAVVTCFAHAEISSDWLPSFPPQERLDLFHSFFAQAPADVLLAVLVTYVSPPASLPHALGALQWSPELYAR